MALKFLRKGKGHARKAKKGPKRRKSKPKPKPRKRPKKRPKKVAVRKPAKKTKKLKRKPKRRPKPKKKARPKPKPKKKAKHVPKKLALPPVEKVPDEKAYAMLKKARIPVVPYMFLKSEKDLPKAFRKLGFPLVLKVSGRSIMHKTEIGGIKYASNGGQAIAAFKELLKIKGAERVLIQKKLTGIELIVGAKAAPQFGHVVSLGIGGVYVEILRDVTFRVVPLTTENAANMVKELKGYDILAGARGKPAINFEALYDVLVAVGRLAAREKVKEMDINPLFCTPEGCWAADIRIVK